MAGRVAVITGCNTGIGKESATELHKKGYEVVFACRSKDKAMEAIAEVAARNKADDGDARLKFVAPFDTSSFTVVKDFCEAYKKAYTRLDVLILNAGSGYIKKEDRITKDGFEAIFQINFLSHYLMTLLMVDLLKKTDNARVVCLSSVEHRSSNAVCNWDTLAKKSTTIKSYPSSKLAMTFLAFELQRRTGIKTAAVNPGFVGSDIWRYLKGWKATMQQTLNATICLTPQQGCQTSVWAATTEDLPAGPVYVSPYKVYDCCPFVWDAVNMYSGPSACNPAKLSLDTKQGSLLWAFSRDAVKDHLPEKLPDELQ
eukprot:TRINITY_DN111438_c0_g1_i1.p1 TRINITY_DN111438_c0_g1~~TRINITY_DN111438_c0_g1_i1.p1  ORF type:complete len:313 (+),score=83.02 TRINITY_DN111438_c0_g1_i1:63-1001(+)